MAESWELAGNSPSELEIPALKNSATGCAIHPTHLMASQEKNFFLCCLLLEIYSSVLGRGGAQDQLTWFTSTLELKLTMSDILSGQRRTL